MHAIGLKDRWHVSYKKITSDMNKSFNIIALLLALAVLFSCTKKEEHDDLNVDLTDPPRGAVDTTLTLKSNIIDRVMHFSVYLPPGYDTSGVDYPVLYLLHGMWGNHRDWVNNGMASTLNYAIYKEEAKPMIVIMPEGIDAFYCNNYGGNSIMYEDFMINELLPHIEQCYRTKNSRNGRAIAGLSMGGYGTTFHAFKRPEMFCCAYSMSGALDMGTSAPNLQTLIDTMSQARLDLLPDYTMECGTEDYLVLESNIGYDEFLNTEGIDHEFIQRSGTHDWNFWKACLPKAIIAASAQFE